MPDFESRFQNWLRWCRQGGSPQHGTVMSAEHAYTARQGIGCPTGWGDYGESVLNGLGTRIEVDLADALLLNRAYIGLADSQRNAIRWVYFFRHWKTAWIARKLDCGHDEVAERVAKARLAMQNRVAMLENQRINRVRLTRETVCCPMGG